MVNAEVLMVQVPIKSRNLGYTGYKPSLIINPTMKQLKFSLDSLDALINVEFPQSPIKILKADGLSFTKIQVWAKSGKSPVKPVKTGGNHSTPSLIILSPLKKKL